MTSGFDQPLPHGQGPYVIIGRPHSGSRLLARLCLANGVFIGSDLTQPFLDSWSWYQRFTVPLVTSRHFPHWEQKDADEELRALCERCINDTWLRYWALTGEGTEALAWGWKYCECLFVMPLLKRYFPGARFIHIIRDGRDVCLSDRGFFQLTGSHANPPGWDPPLVEGHRPSYHDYCRRITFGDVVRDEWDGLELSDRKVLVINRFLIQAQAWITCVTRARQYGALLKSDYYEIRYEDLCHNPRAEALRLFDWMDLPPQANIDKVIEQVSTMQIGKWRRASLAISERRDLGRATELAQALLSALGYS